MSTQHPILKVPVQDLPEQFGGVRPGSVMIYDGDSACYAIAATVKTIPTAVRHFQMDVLSKMFLTKCERAEVHLTSADSLKAGRMNVRAVRPYQGNRTGKARPRLLEAVRQAVADPNNILDEYTVETHYNLEADDACIMSAYRLGDRGVIVSHDKDLRMTPYPYWEASRGEVMPGAGFGEIWDAYTPGGTMKLEGQGRKFFWAQMLMGDTADNVRGLKKYKRALVGPAKALELIKDINDENDVANFVIDAYRDIDQNPIPEGWLMWLLRWHGDNFWNYLEELEFSKENRGYLHECVRRDWYNYPTEDSEDA